MARFLFSNNQTVVKDFQDHCIEVGFNKYVFIVEYLSSQHCCGVSFQKTSVDAINTELFDNGFITIVGTCFYKEQLSSSVLSVIFDDFFQSRDLNALRNNMIGMNNMSNTGMNNKPDPFAGLMSSLGNKQGNNNNFNNNNQANNNPFSFN